MRSLNQAVFAGIVGYDGAAQSGLYQDWLRNDVEPSRDDLLAEIYGQQDFAVQRDDVVGSLNVDKIIKAVRDYKDSDSAHDGDMIYLHDLHD